MITVENHEFQTLIVGLFRYALGRKSYITGMATEIINEYWEEIDYTTQELIIKEIKEYKGTIGMDMDDKLWRGLLDKEDAELTRLMMLDDLVKDPKIWAEYIDRHHLNKWEHLDFIENEDEEN